MGINNNGDENIYNVIIANFIWDYWVFMTSLNEKLNYLFNKKFYGDKDSTKLFTSFL